MELVNQHSRLVIVPVCCLLSINIWWHCTEHIFLTCAVLTVWETDYWSQGSESLLNIVWLEAMCDKYSLSLDIKAYYIVMNDLINKRKSEFLLPLRCLILETFFPLCFSLSDTNLRTWHLRHHLQPLVRPSCNVTLYDTTIAGPVPAQIICKSETRWQTLLVLFALKPGVVSSWIRTWRKC